MINLAYYLEGERLIKYTLFVLYTIPISTLLGILMLSNTMEAILLTISLYYWFKARDKD